MNYRHSFHAGNVGDVLKHVALLELLRLLCAKEGALLYLDSHAGAGGYDLGGDAARTGEWRQGVGRLWGATAAPPAVSRWLAAVAAWNEGGQVLHRYPGSPGLAADALRGQDRLLLCESQPAVADALRRRLAGHDRRVQVIEGDGYHALKAHLPPPERRGLVLVDPPYEAQQAEFDAIVAALREGLRRFPTGVYAIWYPIKQASAVAHFLRQLGDLPVKSALTLELWVRATDSPLRMNGSGLAVLNPPWKLDQEAASSWLPWLARELAQERGAGWRCHWLRREAAAQPAKAGREAGPARDEATRRPAARRPAPATRPRNPRAPR